MGDSGIELGPRGEKPATDHLNYKKFIALWEDKVLKEDEVNEQWRILRKE
jgi:hypothetical protein